MSDAPVEMPEPWERQAGEDEEQWKAFKAYRDMATPRQIKRAASRSMATLSKWYRDNRWKERTILFDRMLDKIKVAETEAIFRQTGREVAAATLASLASLSELTDLEVRKYLATSREGDMPGLIKPGDLVRMFDASVKLVRLVRGETTANIGVSDGVDYDKLSPEEIDVLLALMSKAKKDPGEPSEDDVPRH